MHTRQVRLQGAQLAAKVARRINLCHDLSTNKNPLICNRHSLLFYNNSGSPAIYERGGGVVESFGFFKSQQVQALFLLFLGILRYLLNISG